MTTVDIEHVRARKNDAASVKRKRREAVQTLRDIESKPQRDATRLHELRFKLAQRWVELHVNFPYDAVTQVGKAGFYWKRRQSSVSTFVAWDESARIVLEVTS